MNLAANNRIMIIVPYIIKIFLISYNKKSRGRQFQDSFSGSVTLDSG